MKSYMLDLNSIDRVKGFVKAIEVFDGYFDLATGRYVIDAKSIMGIFSMDLSKPVGHRGGDRAVHSKGITESGWMSDAGRELSVYEGSYTGSFCCVTAVGVPVIESRVKKKLFTGGYLTAF